MNLTTNFDTSHAMNDQEMTRGGPKVSNDVSIRSCSFSLATTTHMAAATVLLAAAFFPAVEAADPFTNLQLGVGPTGLAVLLIVTLFILLVTIPTVQFIWRVFLRKLVYFYVDKAQAVVLHAYERMSMRVSAAGRKISERVRT
jgi:hypothetical protein